MRSPLAAISALALAVPGCFPPDDGRTPPLDRIYFPTGIAISPGLTRLWVVNSDFDLQFNAGTLQAYDLEALATKLPVPCSDDSGCTTGPCDEASGLCADAAGSVCGSLGEQTEAARLIVPGMCKPMDPVAAGVLAGRVGIGAFATDVVFRRHPAERAGRLFVPVRGDATLHYIDVDDDSHAGGGPPVEELACSQGDELLCGDSHRIGDDPEAENTRNLTLPPEPFALAVDGAGEAIAVTHQSDGSISLFVNDWQAAPVLEFVLGGQPTGAVGIASVPEPRVVDVRDIFYQPGFLVTFRNDAQVRLYRYYSDEAASPSRPFLVHAGSVGIAANSIGTDSRGVAIDPSARLACERECDGAHAIGSEELATCHAECAGVPLGVFVANRAPATLLVGQTRSNASATQSDDLPRFSDTVPLSFGPSRVVIGDVLDENGKPQRRAFVVCFDSRSIYIVDPERRAVESVITTGRGPYALAVETAEPEVQDAMGAVIKRATLPSGRAYIAHFTDSYIGVISLDRRHPRTFGTIIASIGTPTPPKASR